MIVAPIPPNALGVDTVAKLSASELRALVGLGYKFRGGYLDELDPAEIDAHRSAGMPLLLLTYANELDPAHALDRLAALGIPAGAQVCLDLEGLKPPDGATPADVEDYVKRKIAEIDAFGEALLNRAHLPTLYCGGQDLLTSAELTKLAVYRYYAGAARLRDRFGNASEPDRGFALFQGRTVNAAIPEVPGKEFDFDWHRLDYRDDGFTAVVP